ncbi:MAG: sigma-70 family RNA polymerase sigma factor [Kiloniellaceae bacterium]
MPALANQPGPPPDAAALAALIVAVGSRRDRAAFARLFAHFAPRIKAYLIRRGAAAGEAEELAQEAMIMVWRRAATYDPAKAGASTWIFTIARNKRIDALRRERHPEYDPEDPAVAAVLAPAGPEAADRAVAAAQRAERLAEAIAALPAEQAELVRMAYFEDKAHGRIAEETSLPLGTVKSRLRLALGHLRKAVGEEAL